MRSKKVRISIAVVAILLFVLPSLFVSYIDERSFTASASQQVTGFQVINSFWGTSSVPASAAPGDRNVPLTVTLQYVFFNSATSIQGLLGLTNGFSLYNGSGSASSSVSGITPDGMIVQMTFQVYLSSNLALGAYILPLNLSWTAAGYAYVLNQTTHVTAYVEGRPQLSFSSPSQTLAPGEVNSVPLVIQNIGSGSASTISITASSQTAGVLNTVPQIQSINAGGQTTYTLQIYVPLAAAGAVVPIALSATYKDPYGNTGSVSQSLFLYVSTTGSSKLQFSTAQQTLVPGEANNVTIVLVDTGTQSLSQVSTTITSGSPSVTIIGLFPYVPTLGANSSTSISSMIEIYVAPTAANSPVTITLSSSFIITQNGMSGSYSQTLGFYTTNYNSPLANTSINVVPVNTTVKAGQNSEVSFKIENAGNSTIYSPSFSLTTATPLVITANSTFSSPSSTIAPKGSVLYEATLTSSPTSTAGTYSGSLAVTISDKQGDERTQTFSVGFKLLGSINIVVQDEVVVQNNATSLLVSGTLLNEGQATAYYAQINASMTGGVTSSNLGSSSEYAGELDSNSPLAFSVVVPLPQSVRSGTARLNLQITYQDSFGQEQSTAGPTKLLDLASFNQPSTPTRTNQGSGLLVGIVRIIVILAIVIAAIVAVVYVRRARQKTPRRAADDKVI